MSLLINEEMTLATIVPDDYINHATFATDVSLDKMIDGGIGFPGEYVEPEVQKPSIFANTFFLGGLTFVVLAAGVGLGILFAKKKIKKGLDYDENY